MTRTVAFNESRTFGVELEVIITNNVPAGHEASKFGLYNYLVMETGLSVHAPAGYHQTGRWAGWKMENDSSLRTSARNHVACIEIISPILKGRQGLADLKKMMDACVAFGCTVNKSCGTHTHHGADDLNGAQLKMVYNLYQRGQAFINSMLAPSRSQNGFSTPLTQTYDEMAERYYGARYADPSIVLPRACADHYRSMNFGGYVTRGAIEFRQHQGTLDFAKLSAWIMMTQAIVEAAKVRKTVRSASISGTRFWEMIGLNGSWTTVYGVKTYFTPSDELVAVRQFMKKRINHFARASRVAA
jgi:hypothetical protein